MLTKILNKIFLIFDYLSDNIGEEHILPILSVIATVVFIVGVGYLMAYLVRIEEENVQKRQYKGNNNNNGIVIKILHMYSFYGFFFCLRCKTRCLYTGIEIT